MDHDELNGRRAEVQMCGTMKDISGDDRRDTGIRMPEAAGTRSLPRDRWSKIADRRTVNENTERRTEISRKILKI
ncbi:hypothetical protein JG687_00009031 [Phytophthora cactorum]|uniref:Uncharacterized protein n=1 Tax=Phytophthora cactorum TaxID=29920 RepID=A0A8T1UAS7_9STRA|nr:hypothetical protein PC120_g3267 [Phytophthora cactorum]KAG4058848.1 hypothetical protein PC123_g6191 [Phytophthora cactorum]KAG6959017.1 hypothetical protein JG687_00009031 [Phytophthora cactorum]